ncbi:hypothetical protein DFP73DRAFT_620979 [Morchella snyderi]|nr:hypothetical protein DFP73DRAFT_620979 [Morchella snyderi]
MDLSPVPRDPRPAGNTPISSYNARILYSTSLAQVEKGYELFVGIRSLAPGPGVSRLPTATHVADRSPTAVPVVVCSHTTVSGFVRSLGPSPEITRIPAAGAAVMGTPSSQKIGDEISSKATDVINDNGPKPKTEESEDASSNSCDQGKPSRPLSIPGSPGYTATTCSSNSSRLSYVEPPFSDAASDVPDDISDWSNSSPRKESQAEGDDYGWSNILTGTPEERRLLLQQLNDLCDRAEREDVQESDHERLSDIQRTSAAEVSDMVIRALCSQWIRVRSGLNGRQERIKRLVEYLRDFRTCFCWTEKEYTKLKLMIYKFELECEDSLLFSPRRKRQRQLTTRGSAVGSDVADHGSPIKPPAQPATCPKCNRICQFPLSSGVVNRCLPCELNLNSQTGRGSPANQRNMTTRYQRFRGCPYRYLEEKEVGGRKKPLLYRKREKLFYDYRAIGRKEEIPKMETHLFYGTKRKREGQAERIPKRPRLE